MSAHRLQTVSAQHVKYVGLKRMRSEIARRRPTRIAEHVESDASEDFTSLQNVHHLPTESASNAPRHVLARLDFIKPKRVQQIMICVFLATSVVMTNT